MNMTMRMQCLNEVIAKSTHKSPDWITAHDNVDFVCVCMYFCMVCSLFDIQIEGKWFLECGYEMPTTNLVQHLYNQIDIFHLC